jgi:hypothetical protein
VKNPTDIPAPAATEPWWRARWAAFSSLMKPRRKVRASPSPAAPVSGALRAFRIAALWGLAVLVATADGAAFSESYRGLFEWAQHHGFSGFWAAAFPLQVDVFIVAGELVLFIAMTDRWSRRDRAGAWGVALLGLAVSIAGNVGHITAHDLQSRGSAAVPPVAAFGALWLGLGVLKRILRSRQETAETVTQNAQQAAERDALTDMIGELRDAVRVLAGRAVPEPAPTPDHSALLGEILGAVHDLAARPGAATREPVPGDAESAALASYRATYLAGNPWSQRQMEIRFGTTRGQFARMRELVELEVALSPAGAVQGPAPAGLNGHDPDPFSNGVKRLPRVGERDDD